LFKVSNVLEMPNHQLVSKYFYQTRCGEPDLYTDSLFAIVFPKSTKKSMDSSQEESGNGRSTGAGIKGSMVQNLSSIWKSLTPSCHKNYSLSATRIPWPSGHSIRLGNQRVQGWNPSSSRQPLTQGC